MVGLVPASVIRVVDPILALVGLALYVTYGVRLWRTRSVPSRIAYLTGASSWRFMRGAWSGGSRQPGSDSSSWPSWDGLSLEEP